MLPIEKQVIQNQAVKTLMTTIKTVENKTNAVLEGAKREGARTAIKELRDRLADDDLFKEEVKTKSKGTPKK